jgi:2-amino-4-hydroxy-6-hydroxymethyldihydropteridine diphosphokinase
MALIYLSIGTNLGNKSQNLNDAIAELSFKVGNLLKVSGFYETEPWGFESKHRFLNAVVLLDTRLLPLQLLAETQQIERNLGRVSKTEDIYSDRLIDIDILLYDNLIVDLPQLKIPHPLMTERDFVIRPLLQIAPDLVHPVTGAGFSDLKF